MIQTIDLRDFFNAFRRSSLDEAIQLPTIFANESLFETPPRQIKELCNSSFPPCDIYVDKEDKTYNIDIALAGMDKNSIDLSIEGSAICLSVKNENSSERLVIQKGIKSFTTVFNKYQIPSDFDIEKAEVEFSNGLLSIEVPLLEKQEPEKKTLKIKFSE